MFTSAIHNAKRARVEDVVTDAAVEIVEVGLAITSPVFDDQ